MTVYALALYLTNRLHVAMHLYIKRAQKASKCGKNISYTAFQTKRGSRGGVKKRERIGSGRVMRGVPNLSRFCSVASIRFGYYFVLFYQLEAWNKYHRADSRQHKNQFLD